MYSRHAGSDINWNYLNLRGDIRVMMTQTFSFKCNRGRIYIFAIEIFWLINMASQIALYDRPICQKRARLANYVGQYIQCQDVLAASRKFT